MKAFTNDNGPAAQGHAAASRVSTHDNPVAQAERAESAPVHSVHHSQRQVAQRRLLDAAFGSVAQRESAEPNLTGMPDQLKSGVEALSGMNLSGVRVHRNSDKPAQLHALAYAQGNDIHLGQGQEQHLPHEAWHVVQQRQGRVQATMQMAGLGVNDDAGLEREADLMGGRALAGVVQSKAAQGRWGSAAPTYAVAQLATLCKTPVFGLVPHWEVVAKGDANGKAPGKHKTNRWQVGLANPRRIPSTSGSVATKPGSVSGVGGEGEVRWTELAEGTSMKGGYQHVAASSAGFDQDLLDQLPANGTRETYRLTNKNCQHFVVTAWNQAGMAPDIGPHLTMSEETGADTNNALLGSAAVGVSAAVMLGLGLPALGLAGLGALGGLALGRLLGGKKKRPKPEGSDEELQEVLSK